MTTDKDVDSQSTFINHCTISMTRHDQTFSNAIGVEKPTGRYHSMISGRGTFFDTPGFMHSGVDLKV